jgi:hypothetical protein
MHWLGPYMYPSNNRDGCCTVGNLEWKSPGRNGEWESIENSIEKVDIYG